MAKQQQRRSVSDLSAAAGDPIPCRTSAASLRLTDQLAVGRLPLVTFVVGVGAVAAGSVGVPVTRARRLVFVVAGIGCGPVVIGGMGNLEGPILGAVAFYLIQDRLQALGSWYLVILGVLAVAFTLLLPHGLWGLAGRFRLFPVGYRLAPPAPDRDPGPGARTGTRATHRLPRFPSRPADRRRPRDTNSHSVSDQQG